MSKYTVEVQCGVSFPLEIEAINKAEAIQIATEKTNAYTKELNDYNISNMNINVIDVDVDDDELKDTIFDMVVELYPNINKQFVKDSIEELLSDRFYFEEELSGVGDIIQYVYDGVEFLTNQENKLFENCGINY